MTDVSGQNGHANVTPLRRGEDDALVDIETERRLLGSFLLSPQLLSALDLHEGDFWGASHQEIYRALCFVHAETSSCSETEVRARLLDVGAYQRIGGDEYFLSLAETTPETHGTVSARRLKRLAIQRRMRDASAQLSSRADNPAASAKYKAELDRQGELLKALELGSATRTRTSKSLAELVETQVSDGLYFPTGFHKLDAELDDGGLPTKSLTVLVGGPGSTKTGVGTHFADHLSRLGVAVVFMACDESRQSVVTRLGQRAGFNRSGLREKGDIGAATRAGHRRYEHELGRVLNLIELDDEADAQTIEEAHEELVRIAGDRPRALVIDSLQTVRCAASEAMPQGADNLRMRIDAKVATLKRLKKTGTIIIVISEVSRAFYNGTNRRIEKEHVLSAAKESGGVEFGVDLLMGLVRSSSDEDLVEFVVAKCRVGREPRFSMRWDRARARHEDAREETPQEQIERFTLKSRELHQRVIKTLLMNPGQSKNEIAKAVKGTRDTALRAVADLTAQGVLLEGPKNVYRISPEHGGAPDGQTSLG